MTSKANPTNYSELREHINQLSDKLSKRLLQCSHFVMSHPEKVALGTTSEIAKLADVQPSTLVRFAQTLGFSGFSEMQRLFKDKLQNKNYDYSQRLEQIRWEGGNSSSALLVSFAQNTHIAIERLITSLDIAALERSVEILSNAGTIYLLGLRRSFPIVSYLYYTFGKLGKKCVLLDAVGGILNEQIACIDEEDTLLLCTFHPYAAETLSFAKAACERGISIITISDTTMSPINRHSGEVLVVQDADVGAFRSLGASMCLASTLAVSIGNKLQEESNRDPLA